MTVIGIDAGATWIKAARFSDSLELVEKVKVASGAARGVAAYCESIIEVVKKLKKDISASELCVGLSLPGVFSKDRNFVMVAPNVKGMERGQDPLDLQKEIGDQLGVKVVGENDAGCAALAEWMFGCGRADTKVNLLLLTWGTGIGTGFISAGKSQFGWEGGHIPVDWSEPSSMACGCGSLIDLESRIGVPHLVAQAEKLWRSKAKVTQLRADDFKDYRKTPLKLIDLAEVGDELALSVIRQALQLMARGLHSMAVIGYPDQVVIGGGMMDRDWLLQELRRHIVEQSSGFLTTTLRPEMVHRAKLGNDAGMIGAAILARQAFGLLFPPRSVKKVAPE